MIKIFLTIRNRLAITLKCLDAIRLHTTVPYQLYVYENQTDYLIEEHFKYMMKLYLKSRATQITFNTDASTFNAFSKASACNSFGAQHEQDPEKDKCDFLLILDNDIILTPNWNEHLSVAWKYVRKNKLNNVRVIGQLPGGIKHKSEQCQLGPDMIGKLGFLGGSGLWSVSSDFFRTVGFLNLKELVGHTKRHDQLYWQLLHKSTSGKPYIMGIDKKLGIHCGMLCGSVCNTLTRLKGKKVKTNDCIKFEESETAIRGLGFQEFFDQINNNTKLTSDW